MKMHRATRSLIPQPLEPAPNSTRGESRTPRSPLAARLAAVAVAVVTLALTASWSHAFGQEARSRDRSDAAFLQEAVAPANQFDRSSGGRLTLAFGSLPPRALCRNAHWQWEDLSQQWFAGADCTDAQLQSAKLIGTNFRGAILNGAQMQDAMMWFVDLDSAHLLKANLRHADLGKGSLRHANMEQSDLRRAIFKSANLTEANLLGAKVAQANFTNANLQGAILTGLIMDGVNFTGANLTGADLSRADLRYTVGLTAAQLKSANTDGALTPDNPAASSGSH
jgi:uncharacterized protein YjbI with pentapeptide repeats